jgi:hypothetical protein
MIALSVPMDLVEHCRQLTNHRNYGNRYTGDNGNHEQQMTGTIGECMIRSLFGRPWMSVDDRPGSDFGCDIDHHGIRIDVKTTSSTDKVSIEGVQHYHVSQEKMAKTDVYLFTTLNKRTLKLFVNGWVTRKEFVKYRLFLAANQVFHVGPIHVCYNSDQYLIENRYLHFARSPRELIDSMNELTLRGL